MRKVTERMVLGAKTTRSGVALAGKACTTMTLRPAIRSSEPSWTWPHLRQFYLGKFRFTPIEKRLADKGAAAIEASLAGIKAGFEAAAGFKFDKQLAKPAPKTNLSKP